MPQKQFQKAFTLPTVVIVSVIMMIVLAATIQLSSSAVNGLKEQYYGQLSKEAAEAGLAHAEACLKNNNYMATWTDSSPLRPWTDCFGNGTEATCTPMGNCHVMLAGNVKTTYRVNEPETSGGFGSQQIPAIGELSLLRTSDSTTYKSYNATSKGRVGGVLGVEGVFFGYSQGGGELRPFFLTKTSDGKLQGAGYNGDAVLSTGNQTSVATPADYSGLPPGATVKKVYTQFKSGDRSTLVLLNDGRLYVAGNNDKGGLGLNPAITPYVTSARHYDVGEPVKSAFAAGSRKYAVGDSGRLYSTGQCNEVGLPSFNDGGGNCWNPRPVEGLPAPTTPSTKISSVIADGGHNYAITEGGRLYGWSSSGGDLCGVMPTASRTPVRIGVFGDVGQRRVVKIETDGIGLFALLDNGQLLSGGCVDGGHLASTQHGIRTEYDMFAIPRCIDIQGGISANTTPVQYYNCNDDPAQHWSFDEDYKIRNSSILPGGNRCLDLRGGIRANGTPIQIYDCMAGNQNQEWVYWDDDSIRLRANTNFCLSTVSTPVVSGTDIVLWACDGQQWQKWNFPNVPGLRPVNLQSGWTVIDMATDFASLLMLVDTNGDGASDRVYGAGKNHVGQLGIGSGVGAVQEKQPRVARFILPTVAPNAVRPISLFHTGHVSESANTLVVTERVSDPTIREVYGAGTNAYGQLGLGYNTAYESTPQRMTVIQNASLAMVGGNMSAIFTNDGFVYTMGRNNYGQLGDGSTIDSPVPQVRRYINSQPLVIY